MPTSKKQPTNKHTPKFTKVEREEHLFKVAKLARKRWSQIRISKELGVSQQQISYDMKVIRKRYHDSYIQDQKARVEETRQQYNDLLEELWDAVEKSKRDAEKEICEEYLDEGGDVTGGKRTHSREGRILEAAYTSQISKILKDLRELDGLDPKKDTPLQQVNISWDAMFVRSPITDPFAAKIEALEKSILEGNAREKAEIGLKEIPSSQETNGVGHNGERS